MKYLYFLLVFACWSESVSSQESIQAAISATNIQNGFLKNMGQVRDFKNKAVDFVYYQASIGGQQVFLTNYGLAIQFSRVKKITRVGGLNKSKNINRERTIADS
ncbi:MAG: hypothetical protein ACXWCZ_00325 [Flavisolibacter sp.]